MSNVETAYTFFLNQGFTSAQASGIVGNLIQESGVNPESVQSGGPGRGIAQWSLGGRWNPSLATGNPSTDLSNQLNYVMQELQSDPSYGLSALKTATTPIQAAQIFGTDYERYGIAGARLQDAQQVYNEAQSNNWPTASSGTSAVLTSGNGGSSIFGSLWDAVKSSLGFTPIGQAAGAISDVGRIGEEIAGGIAFGTKEQPQDLKGNGFLESVNELMNPSVSLFNPWGIITMAMARGGVALFGLALIGAGILLIAFRTQTGREAMGAGVDAGKLALL